MGYDRIKWRIYTLCGKRYQKTWSPLKDYYTTVKEYIADINASIPEEDKGKITFTVYAGKVTITLESGYEIHLRKEQAIILGFLTFDDTDIVKKITTAETGNHEANLHRETNIYVYSDIVHPFIEWTYLIWARTYLDNTTL